MGLSILSPQNSFVQFNESDLITESCEFKIPRICLPVYADDDVAWQFFVKCDSPAEADALCTQDQSEVQVGITDGYGKPNLITFAWKPERFRVDDYTVGYNCDGGLTNFGSVISVGGCLYIHLKVFGIYAAEEAWSNCFQRIGGICHTTVLEYNNDDNAFGFDYCGGGAVAGISTTSECIPTIVSFVNVTNVSIPYTASMKDKYGDVPTIKVWTYDGGGHLVDTGMIVSLDAFPPAVINIDLGGLASGYVVIS